MLGHFLVIRDLEYGYLYCWSSVLLGICIAGYLYFGVSHRVAKYLCFRLDIGVLGDIPVFGRGTNILTKHYIFPFFFRVKRE